MEDTQLEHSAPSSPQPSSKQQPLINSLPPELLAEIFQYTRDRRKARRCRNIRFLSQVDRRWRSVALGTPQLWTTIIASHPFKESCDRRYIALQLERANGLPVTLVLRGIKPSSVKPFVEVLEMVAPSVDTMYFDGGNCWPLVGDLKDVALGSLSFPRLRRFKCYHTAPLPTAKHLLHTMPVLEQVSLEIKAGCNSTMIKAFLPWLTHFSAWYSDADTIADLFWHAPSLRYCYISTNETNLQLSRPFKHDNLCSLFIHAWKGRTQALGEWVPSFPNLKHLGVTIGADGTTTVPRLLQPSGAQLQYLELCPYAYTLDQFSQCLAHMPELRFLHLYGRVSEACINALRYHPESNPIVPKLEVITISGIEFKSNVLWELALSRARDLEHGIGDGLVNSFSVSPTFDLSSKFSAVQLRNRQSRGALWYIKLIKEKDISALRSRFAPMVSRMQRTLGITLKIAGGDHHISSRDAMDLLGVDVRDDSHWDWRWTV